MAALYSLAPELQTFLLRALMRDKTLSEDAAFDELVTYDKARINTALEKYGSNERLR